MFYSDLSPPFFFAQLKKSIICLFVSDFEAFFVLGANAFFHFVDDLFTFFTLPLEAQVFNSVKVQFIFPLITYAFGFFLK